MRNFLFYQRGFGNDTTATYVFHSNAAKEYIAEVTLDSTLSIAQEVTFKDNGVLSSIGDLHGVAQTDVIVSPNPVTSSGSFTLSGLAPGNYDLRMFNSAGVLVLNKKIEGQNDPVSTASMGNGLYIYQVYDDKNRLVTFGKIVIASH